MNPKQCVFPAAFLWNNEARWNWVQWLSTNVLGAYSENESLECCVGALLPGWCLCTENNTLNKYLTKYPSAQWECCEKERGRQELLVICAWVHLYYLGQWTEVDPEVKIPTPASHQGDAVIWHLKYIQQDEWVDDAREPRQFFPQHVNIFVVLLFQLRHEWITM